MPDGPLCYIWSMAQTLLQAGPCLAEIMKKSEVYQYYPSKIAFPKLNSQKDCRSAVVLLNNNLVLPGEPKTCLSDGLGELNELIQNTLSSGIRVLKLKFYHSIG